MWLAENAGDANMLRIACLLVKLGVGVILSHLLHCPTIGCADSVGQRQSCTCFSARLYFRAVSYAGLTVLARRLMLTLHFFNTSCFSCIFVVSSAFNFFLIISVLLSAARSDAFFSFEDVVVPSD